MLESQLTDGSHRIRRVRKVEGFKSAIAEGVITDGGHRVGNVEGFETAMAESVIADCGQSFGEDDVVQACAADGISLTIHAVKSVLPDGDDACRQCDFLQVDAACEGIFTDRRQAREILQFIEIKSHATQEIENVVVAKCLEEVKQLDMLDQVYFLSFKPAN